MPSKDPDLIAAAEEELAQAATLGWNALSRVTPWGDAYEGYAPGGRAVTFERNYLWRDGEGGDILIEVAAFSGETRRNEGAVVTLVLAKP
jgi:hypothetical protein